MNNVEMLRSRASESNDGNLATVALNAACQIERLEKENKTLREQLKEFEQASLTAKPVNNARNDKALWLVRETDFEMFLLRASKETGEIEVNLICNDIFIWGCADCEPLPDEYWEEFKDLYYKSFDDLHNFDWYAEAWAVKLRKVAPQKPATDRYPDFVRMLEWLEVDWQNMKRYDEIKES